MNPTSYDIPTKSTGTGTLWQSVPAVTLVLCQSILAPPPGVSQPARLLTQQFHQLLDNTRTAEAEALAMGWAVPSAARIPLALEGLGDADWHLEPDEMAF